jgi:hypothetical protein
VTAIINGIKIVSNVLRTVLKNKLQMKIAYISTYSPRECGIATFNYNLIRAIEANRKSSSVTGFVVAMNDSDDLNE